MLFKASDYGIVKILYIFFLFKLSFVMEYFVPVIYFSLSR